MDRKHGYNYNLLEYQYNQTGAVPINSRGLNNYQFRQTSQAENMVEQWPGPPIDPSNPVFSFPLSREYDPFPFVRPVKATRRRRRGGGYSNLYNYNTIP